MLDNLQLSHAVRQDTRSTQRNERITGTTKVEEISKKVQESRLKWYVHCTCNEKRRKICRQESDCDGGAREKKERKTKAEVVG